MRDNIARLLLSTLISQQSKIVLEDELKSLSRNELLAHVERQARQFLQSGLKADDFVVVLCDRGHRFWIEVLAGWVIGVKVICVEADISDAHAQSINMMTNVAYICHDGVECPSGFSHLHKLPFLDESIEDERSSRQIFAELPFPNSDTTPDMAGLIFTSGTTGLPKGVPLSHRALSMNALATATRLKLRAEDRLLLATPFRFISSISHFIVTLMSGATLVGIERKLLVKDLLDAINSFNVSAFGGSPFHMQFIAMAGKDRLPSLRWAMSSGDHLRTQVIEQLMKSFDDLELHVVYGMAELGGRFCSLPPERLSDKAGSVGFPLPGFEFTIRDSNGCICEPQEIGEIHVGGILEFKGYFSNPESNAKVLGEYGFRNGDVGYLDEDGFLFLSGRSDAVFKRSGLKVSAQVISDVLNQLPEINDAHAAGEQNDIEGHVPIAYVVWKDEALSDGELTAKLRDVLPTNHIPRRYIALTEIPRTGSGKVDRRRLDDLVSSNE